MSKVNAILGSSLFGESVKQTGKSNTQYETKWIYSNNLRESKKVHKEYELTGDWKLGRVMKFDYLEKSYKFVS